MTEKRVSEGLHIKEYVVADKWTGRETKQIVHNELVAGPIADFAMELMRHLAIVSGIEDGEDSSGRAKARLATPQEVVDRACEIAALSFDQFSDRGWLLRTNPPTDIAEDDETDK